MLQCCVLEFMLDNAITTITEKYANNIWSKYWIKGFESKNTYIASGFRATCMLPLYFTDMKRHLKFFKDGGIPLSE